MAAQKAVFKLIIRVKYALRAFLQPQSARPILIQLSGNIHFLLHPT